MKKLKRASFILLSFLSISSSFSCFSVLAQKQITVYVNDNLLEFDVDPILVDNRTLVPLRAIFETLNCEVDWDNDNNKVIAYTPNNQVISLTIGESELYLDDELLLEMDVPAQILNARTLVPLRAISESLGCEVEWVQDDYTVLISTDDSNTTDNEYFFTFDLEKDNDVVMEFIIDVENKELLTASQSKALNTAINSCISKWRDTYEKEVYSAHDANRSAFLPLSLHGNCVLTQDDKGYISYLFKGIIDWDNEITSTTKSFVFNSNDNTAVSISDVVDGMSQSDWNDFYIQSFESIINAYPDKFHSNALDILHSRLSDIGFYLTPEGIVFFMPDGILGDYDIGFVSFLVNFDY